MCAPILPAVRAVLERDEHLSSMGTTVLATGDAAVLHGGVQSPRREPRAQELAEGICGAGRVRSELRAVPAGNPRDEVVAEGLRTLLAGAQGVGQESSVVSVVAGRVTLSGSVATGRERVLVGDQALRNPGARSPDDHPVIAHPENAEDTGASRSTSCARTGGSMAARPASPPADPWVLSPVR